MPLLLLILLLGSAGEAAAQQLDLSGWFPFNPSGIVAAGSAADASDLLLDVPGEHAGQVIDRRGRVVAGPDGHFYFEKTGHRARFFGTNSTFSTSFPPNPDAPQQSGEYSTTVPLDAAAQLATRLQRMGVNLVRFHHMEMYNRPRGIWDPAYPNDTLHLDALQLRRLDYLIYQLRQRGIYTNLNLHVSRQFRRDDGVKDWNLFKSGGYNKGATQFDPVMIGLQEKYSEALLGHVNPYTGLRLADDPAVAFVEISNEDSLLYEFNNDRLNCDGCNPLADGHLPPSYSADLDRMWNQWLQRKYGGDEALAAAWQASGATSANYLANPGFENGLSGWTANPIGSGVAAAFATTTADKQEGGSAAQISVTQVDGTAWHVQLLQKGLTVEAGQRYEVTFWAKAAAGTPAIDLVFQKDIDPWTGYASFTRVTPGNTWAQYSLSFRSNYTDPGHTMLVFNLGAATGTLLIDGVLFRSVAPTGLGGAESLAAATVLRPPKSQLGRYSDARARDLTQFYFETERNYWQEMRRYIREDLGSRALVTGTAPFWFYLGDTESQAGLDFIDGHLYFDHPSWPAGNNWASTGWVITNKSFADDPFKRMFSIASGAVLGKPYTVSEFNQPFPNDYQAEGLLWMAAWGNFHDWDGILQFDYGPGPDQYLTDVSRNFFSIAGNAIKSAEMPVVARMFMAGQNSPAAGRQNLAAGHDELMLAGPSLNSQSYFSNHGVNAAMALYTSLRTGPFAPGNAPDYSLGAAPPARLVSDNAEITFDRTSSAAPYLQVASPSLNALCGFYAGQTIKLPNMTVALGGAPPPFASIALQPLDRRTLDSSERLLLSVLTRMQNTGMQWNPARTSVNDKWGAAPVLIEPASGTITLSLKPGVRYHVYALDSSGNRAGEAASGQDQFSFQFDMGAQRTVWYEIAADAASLPAPAIGAGGVVGSANWKAPIVSGGLVSIFGSNMASGTAEARAFPLPFELAGASVLIGGRAAPLLYVSPGQINAQAPWGLPEGANDVVVVRGSARSAPEPVTVVSANPGIFAVVPHAPRADCDNCVRAGDFLIVWATGLGDLRVETPAGLPAGVASTMAEVTATIGGIPAVVSYAGTAPNYAGLNQVNVIVPPGLPAGSASLVISAAGRDSNPSTLTIGK